MIPIHLLCDVLLCLSTLCIPLLCISEETFIQGFDASNACNPTQYPLFLVVRVLLVLRNNWADTEYESILANFDLLPCLFRGLWFPNNIPPCYSNTCRFPSVIASCTERLAQRSAGRISACLGYSA